MKFGVLVFPGSNCDHDTYNVIAEVAHQPVTFLWHDSEDLQAWTPCWFRAIRLRRLSAHGAIARFSPVMQAVKRFAAGVVRCWASATASDSDRVWPAARSADAQRGPEIHLQAGAPAHGDTNSRSLTS